MYLYLVQHGEAKPEEEDPSRGLTEKGMEDARNSARSVKGMNIDVPVIFHSGKKRALQTARIIEEEICPGRGVFEAEGLAPMDDPGGWAARLAAIKEDTMLVGHLPHLARLSALLLCGDRGNGVLDFTNGGIMRLRRSQEGNWTVNWIIKPGMQA
ncbi:MAG: phosphohistidine phosphatase SixA [Nitrospiraceae bacterium]|nr:MAG: phosphohistidine phosphatase SixA [Nitrospiraceae bacterium]